MKSSSENLRFSVITEKTEEQLGQILELDQACFPEDPWSRDVWSGLFDNRVLKVFIVSIEHQPVGFVTVALIPPEAELLRVGVREPYRRRSLGSKLLGQVFRDIELDGITSIFLEVREENEAACRLYEENNFEKIGERKGYYRFPPGNAVIYKCSEL